MLLSCRSSGRAYLLALRRFSSADHSVKSLKLLYAKTNSDREALQKMLENFKDIRSIRTFKGDNNQNSAFIRVASTANVSEIEKCLQLENVDLKPYNLPSFDESAVKLIDTKDVLFRNLPMGSSWQEIRDIVKLLIPSTLSKEKMLNSTSALVTFPTAAEASKVLHVFNQSEFLGCTLSVTPHHSGVIAEMQGAAVDRTKSSYSKLPKKGNKSASLEGQSIAIEDQSPETQPVKLNRKHKQTGVTAAQIAVKVNKIDSSKVGRSQSVEIENISVPSEAAPSEGSVKCSLKEASRLLYHGHYIIVSTHSLVSEKELMELFKTVGGVDLWRLHCDEATNTRSGFLRTWKLDVRSSALGLNGSKIQDSIVSVKAMKPVTAETTVHVSNVPPATAPRELYSLLQSAMENATESFVFFKKKNGDVYASFENSETADLVATKLNNYLLNNHALRVTRLADVSSGIKSPKAEIVIKAPVNGISTRTVVVSNLPPGITRPEFNTLVSPLGPISHFNFLFDAQLGNLGVARVTFNSAKHVQNCISTLNGLEFKGRQLIAEVAFFESESTSEAKAKYEGRYLCIPDLNPATTCLELETYLLNEGFNVVHASISRDRNHTSSKGFVVVDRKETATRLVQCSTLMLHDHHITAHLHKKYPLNLSRDPRRQVIVTNLPKDLSREELQARFASVGVVRYGQISSDGCSAVVEFESTESVRKAMDTLNKSLLKDQQLSVSAAVSDTADIAMSSQSLLFDQNSILADIVGIHSGVQEILSKKSKNKVSCSLQEAERVLSLIGKVVVSAPSSISEKDLIGLLKSEGKLNWLHVVCNKSTNTRYAAAEFKQAECAVDAITKLNKMKLGGSAVSVSAMAPVSKETTIFVSNLAHHTKTTELFSLIQAHMGNVSYCPIVAQIENGSTYVSLHSSEAAALVASKLNNFRWKNRIVSVTRLNAPIVELNTPSIVDRQPVLSSSASSSLFVNPFVTGAGSRRLLISDIYEKTEWVELTALLHQAGKVVMGVVNKDSGAGFVEFDCDDTAVRAAEIIAESKYKSNISAVK